jgi:hypothetical protein
MAPTESRSSRQAMTRDASRNPGLQWRRCAALMAGAALFASTSVQGAEWTFVPRATLMETWTDNVGLDPSGEEDSDWITELRPGFALGTESARLTAQIDYELQALWYAERSDRNDIFHRARANGTGVLVPDSVFVDAFADYDQRNIDPAGRVDFGNLFDTGNRTDALVFGVSPYHVGRWGTWAESLVRYDYRGVRYYNSDETSVNLQESDGDTISAELGSQVTAAGLSWKVHGLYTRTEFDDFEATGRLSEFEYAQAALDLGVPIGLRTRLTGTIGQESDISENSTKGGLDTTFWYVGFAWNPDALQSLEARVGERYFGTSWGGSYTRRASRGTLSLDYSEAPTTSAGLLGDSASLPPGVRPGSEPRLDTRVFLNKRLTGTASYELARSSINLQLYSSRRIYEDEAGGTERNLGARLRYDWDFAPRTRIGASAGWERREFSDNDGRDNLGDFELRLRRELTRILSGEFRVGHVLRNSELNSDYNANTVSLSVTAVF